jgi:hypothetical protein
VRTGFVLILAGSALALGACGSSGGSGGSADASSSDSDQETAQLKLQECLRRNGVDLPGPGSGSSGGAPRIARPSAAERQKVQKALSGPCKKYQQKAFGNISKEDREEMRDRMVKFSSCMRKHGVDLPDGRPGQGEAAVRFDADNPKFRKAQEACRKLLPRPPGGGGRGDGPRIMIGPGPGSGG